MNFYTSLIYKTVFVLFLLTCSSVHSQTADSNAYYKIGKIEITGNRKTKDRIILRELIKKEQDTFLLKNISRLNRRQEYNIFNTQLFIYDTIACIVNDSSKLVNYKIKVKERWYIWPIPFVDYLDRNINAWWQNKDVSRLAYGLQLSLENFSGVKDRLLLQFRTGYADQLVINYRLPYLNKKQTLGAYVQYAFNEFNKLQYTTTQNKQQFVVDDVSHLRIDNSVRAGLFFRPRLFEYHAFDVGAYHVWVSDRINSLNPNYLINSNNTLSFISLSYRATYDDRDNKIYPLKGTVLDLTISKDGLNTKDDSPLDYAQTILTFKEFIPLHSKFNLATLWRARLVNTEQQVPFIYNQALGYSNFIRGYEYHVIDGQNFFLTKNSLRFELFKPKFHEIDKLKKLRSFSTIPFYAYVNLFIDAGRVQEKYYHQQNTFANNWQYGYGVGLDLITYYDFVMRMEYSINKMKQSGFFIHFASGF